MTTAPCGPVYFVAGGRDGVFVEGVPRVLVRKTVLPPRSRTINYNPYLRQVK